MIARPEITTLRNRFVLCGELFVYKRIYARIRDSFEQLNATGTLKSNRIFFSNTVDYS